MEIKNNNYNFSMIYLQDKFGKIDSKENFLWVKAQACLDHIEEFITGKTVVIPETIIPTVVKFKGLKKVSKLIVLKEDRSNFRVLNLISSAIPTVFVDSAYDALKLFFLNSNLSKEMVIIGNDQTMQFLNYNWSAVPYPYYRLNDTDQRTIVEKVYVYTFSSPYPGQERVAVDKIPKDWLEHFFYTLESPEQLGGSIFETLQKYTSRSSIPVF